MAKDIIIIQPPAQPIAKIVNEHVIPGGGKHYYWVDPCDGGEVRMMKFDQATPAETVFARAADAAKAQVKAIAAEKAQELPRIEAQIVELAARMAVLTAAIAEPVEVKP